MQQDIEIIKKAAEAYGCSCRITKNDAGVTNVIIMSHGSLMHVFSIKEAIAWADYRESIQNNK